MNRPSLAVLVFPALMACAPRLPATLTAPRIDPALTWHGPVGVEASEAPAPWSLWAADPGLRSLIEEALGSNFDVQRAANAVARAGATLRAARGARLPAVSAEAGASLTRFPVYTMDGAGYIYQPIVPGEALPSVYPELGVGVSAAWTLSPSGRHRRDAAREALAVAEARRSDVASALVASVAAAWYELHALDRTVEILESSVLRQERALELVRLQKAAARADELAVQQLEASLADTRAASLDARQRRAELELGIQLLVGRPLSAVPRSPGALATPPAVPTVGLPADVLAHRPDIRAAERAIAAAGFQLRAARAAFYPSLNLGAGVGLAAFQPRYFTNPASLGFGLGAGIVAPVVNRAAIAADFAVADADRLDALVDYQEALLRAVVEVSSALAGLDYARGLVAERAGQRSAAARATEVSSALFTAAKATYIDVLLAEQAVLDAEQSMVTAQLEQHWRAIRLYRALGGGWEGLTSGAPEEKAGPRR